MQTALAFNAGPWLNVADGHPGLRDFYNRHYSSSGCFSPLILGPGEKLILVTPSGDAVFGWRFSKYWSDEEGVNCAVFRNESPLLSSDLILAAEEVAVAKWGAVRFFTFVNPHMIASPNPGYCFKRAGWRQYRTTKGGLIALEKLPA